MICWLSRCGSLTLYLMAAQWQFPSYHTSVVSSGVAIVTDILVSTSYWTDLAQMLWLRTEFFLTTQPDVWRLTVILQNGGVSSLHLCEVVRETISTLSKHTIWNLKGRTSLLQHKLPRASSSSTPIGTIRRSGIPVKPWRDMEWLTRLLQGLVLLAYPVCSHHRVDHGYPDKSYKVPVAPCLSMKLNDHLRVI